MAAERPAGPCPDPCGPAPVPAGSRVGSGPRQAGQARPPAGPSEERAGADLGGARARGVPISLPRRQGPGTWRPSGERCRLSGSSHVTCTAGNWTQGNGLGAAVGEAGTCRWAVTARSEDGRQGGLLCSSRPRHLRLGGALSPPAQSRHADGGTFWWSDSQWTSPAGGEAGSTPRPAPAAPCADTGLSLHT